MREKIVEICPICSKKISPNNHTPYNDIGWSNWGLFNDLKLTYCNFCGFGFSVPELNEKVVNHFYERQYRSKESTFHIDFLKLRADEKELMGKNARLYFEKEFDRKKQTNSIINIFNGIRNN